MKQTTKSVNIVVFDGVMSLDAFGPLEVFDGANAALSAEGKHPLYASTLVSVHGKPIVCSSGITVSTRRLAARHNVSDTIIVAGGDGTRDLLGANPLIEFLQSARPRRLASVCSGSLLLAEAGRLDGREATTHWSMCAFMAERYPAVTVLADPIYVRDGNVATSAGVTAGIDLALSLVEEDVGAAIAATVAKHLVMFVRRPGGQSQFSVQMSTPPASSAPVQRVQEIIVSDLTADLRVGSLARQVAVSERHLARIFRAETGQTIARYVEASRLESARQLLESTDTGIDAVARSSGFAVPDTFRRVFSRTFGVTPSSYRRTFRHKSSAVA